MHFPGNVTLQKNNKAIKIEIYNFSNPWYYDGYADFYLSDKIRFMDNKLLLHLAEK